MPATSGQLNWLRKQAHDWVAEGLVQPDQAASILGRYQASRRFSLGRLLLGVGATFTGVGLIWLVAANLDEFSPLTRFAVVLVLWLAALVGAETLAARGGSPLVTEAVRLLAALGLGAVIFQAAQSLQVPAYEPKLVGLWGAGALVHAYVLRAYSPLLVGIAAVTTFSVWQGLHWPDPTFTRAVLVLTLSAVVAVAVAALHDGRPHDAVAQARWRHAFAGPWRHVGAGLVLVGLFVAGFPVDEGWEITWTWWVVALAVLGALAAAAALAVARDLSRYEVLGSVAVLAIGLVLAAWSAGGDANDVEVQDWAHAILGVVTYVVVAVGIAAIGTLRDSWLLTAMATAGLVVFTTFQSFAVFAPIIQGAWLFVVLGLIFLATGIGFDRGRRRLAAALDDEAPPDAAGPQQQTEGTQS